MERRYLSKAIASTGITCPPKLTANAFFPDFLNIPTSILTPIRNWK